MATKEQENSDQNQPKESKDKSASQSANRPENNQETVSSQNAITESKEQVKKPEQHRKTVSAKTARSGKRQFFPLVASVALLVAVAVAAAAYWQFQQSRALASSIEQLANQQSKLDQQLNDLSEEASNIDDQQQSLIKRADQSEDNRRSLVVSLDQLSSQVQSLTIAKGKQPVYWRVSEVEYLLTIANHRLTLERDVNTAKTALQDADKRLRSIGDPGLIPVREKINDEVNRLNSVTLPDIPGMAAQINSLIGNVEKLPFVKKSMSLDSESAEAPEREYTGFTQFVKTVWEDVVNGLFKVQRTDQPVEPLLPPGEKQYLVNNLRLKLEQANIALLQSDSALLNSNLANAEQWLQRYFESSSPSVTTTLETIDRLKSTDLTPSLPDISGSLRELRAWMATQQNTAQVSHRIRPNAVASVPGEVTSP